MSKAIASGRLQLSDYISSSDSAVIESAINEFGADCLEALFDTLKEQYSFGQLRAVAAAMNLS